ALDTFPAPDAIGLQQYFGVRVRTEGAALTLEFTAQFYEVINLAVVADPISSLWIEHRLMTGIRQIDDGETLMTKHHLLVILASSYGDQTTIIRPPMSDRRQTAGNRRQSVFAPPD